MVVARSNLHQVGYSFPCWEMNSHTSVADRTEGATARIQPALNEAVRMVTMLLPGTVIVYYGSEIGEFFSSKC